MENPNTCFACVIQAIRAQILPVGIAVNFDRLVEGRGFRKHTEPIGVQAARDSCKSDRADAPEFGMSGLFSAAM
jgi:hypothetical protein